MAEARRWTCGDPDFSQARSRSKLSIADIDGREWPRITILWIIGRIPSAMRRGTVWVW